MTKRAKVLIAIAPVVLGAAALFSMPPIAQDQAYHAFKDTRALWGIPNFGDVVSNLGFVLVGLAGVLLAGRFRLHDARERTMWWIHFAGQLLTGLGSAYYHAAPDDARLVWDRLPLTAVIMSLVAIVISERISLKAGWRLLAPLLLGGVASIVLWRATDDLRLYALVQFGSILFLLLVMSLFRPSYTLGVGYGAAIGFYAAAKGCELFDAAIFEALRGAVSGHTLKHVLAGAAGAALLVMLIARESRRPSSPPT